MNKTIIKKLNNLSYALNKCQRTEESKIILKELKNYFDFFRGGTSAERDAI